MTADRDRRPGGGRAGPGREQVADLVAADLAAGGTRPLGEQGLAGCILVCQRDPGASAVRGRTDRGQLHQASPEPLAVRA
jgi:hypothetical protein